MATPLVSLQFTGAGDLALDEDGNPVYSAPPTGDLYLATAERRGAFHADPDLGGEVQALVTGGDVRGQDEIRNAIETSLARLVAVGTLVVDDILVFDDSASVYTSATDQPFVVTL
jgi:hypothetical protein